MFNAYTAYNQYKEAKDIKPVEAIYEKNGDFEANKNMMRNQMFSQSQGLQAARDRFSRTTASNQAAAMNSGMSAAQRAAMLASGSSQQARSNQSLMAAEEDNFMRRQGQYLQAVRENDQENKFVHNQKMAKYLRDLDRKDTLNANAMHNLQEGIGQLGTTFMMGMGDGTFAENYSKNFQRSQNPWYSDSAYGGAEGMDRYDLDKGALPPPPPSANLSSGANGSTTDFVSQSRGLFNQPNALGFKNLGLFNNINFGSK